MNNTSLISLESERIELLKKYSLDENNINEFKNRIKEVPPEKSNELGKNLLELVSKKSYSDDYEKALDLILNGANIEYKNEKKGDYALLICARKNYFQTFLSLIKAGANINQVNNYLTTATMASARHGNIEMLKILITLGADINARCLDGDNAIMSAKMHEQTECFNMLVNAGAYLNNRNLANKTILDLQGKINIDSKLFEEDTKELPITEETPLELIKEAKLKLSKLKNR